MEMEENRVNSNIHDSWVHSLALSFLVTEAKIKAVCFLRKYVA